MSRLLTLARASRLLGISRVSLQQEIRDGKITTFEGKIYLAELERAYPGVQIESSNMLERVQHIKDNAYPRHEDERPINDIDTLRDRVAGLQRELAAAQMQIRWYIEVMNELVVKLETLQHNVDQQQCIFVASIKTWLRHKIDY